MRRPPYVLPALRLALCSVSMLLTLGVTSTPAGFAQSAGRDAPVVQLAASSVVQGAQLQISGAHFTPNGVVVTLQLVPEWGGQAYSLPTAGTDAQGGFATST